MNRFQRENLRQLYYKDSIKPLFSFFKVFQQSFSKELVIQGVMLFSPIGIVTLGSIHAILINM